MEDKIKDALCDMYDIKRQSELHKFGKLPKDNDGTSTTILDCINSVISFLEQLDYPELSTKDINEIVKKYGWKPMDTKDGLAWFGGGVMSEEELQKLIYKTIKDWVDEEAELNDHNEGTREDNFENSCKQLSRWATEIKDDYKKYVDRPME